MKKTAVAVLLLMYCLSGLAAARSTRNIKDLKTALRAHVPVVMVLGADSCHFCRMMKPVMAKLAVEKDGRIIFLDIDVEKHKDLAYQFKVTLVPTIVFYDRHGRAKATKIGYMSKPELLKAVRDLNLNK